MNKRLGAVLVLAAVFSLSTEAAQAGTALPGEVIAEIKGMAIAGRESQDGRTGLTAPIENQENRKLTDFVIEAIAREPGLGVVYLEAAIEADPKARDRLIERIRTRFPELGAIVDANPGWRDEMIAAAAPPDPTTRYDENGNPPRKIAKRAVIDNIVYLDAPPNGMEFIPLSERPADFPILPEEGGADGYADIDPLEPINKAFFYFNGTLDYIFIEPITLTYKAIMPDAAEEALTRAYDNLGQPITMINDVLQGEFERAGIALGRFLFNTTFGILGLFDVATSMNLPAHEADFGQTLHSWGLGDGIYVVLPFFGPMSARDAVGLGFDIVVDPRQYVFEGDAAVALSVGQALVRRAQVIGPADFIEAYAERPYDAVRAWKWQQRTRFLEGACGSTTTTPCLPSPVAQ